MITSLKRRFIDFLSKFFKYFLIVLPFDYLNINVYDNVYYILCIITKCYVYSHRSYWGEIYAYCFAFVFLIFINPYTDN